MRFLKAEKIFDGNCFLADDTVVVVNESGVQDLATSAEIDPLKIQTLKGVITPGFINAHCHLELSHLKSVIAERTGLPEFGMQIMKHRNSFSKEFAEECMKAADESMWTNGIVATADISNTSASFMIKTGSKIKYHTFIELLGLHPGRAASALAEGENLQALCSQLNLGASLAPHAPYSTSIELINNIAAKNERLDLPSTIHNQESEDEMKFFRGEPSGFDKLYQFLKIDITFFKPPMCSSLEHYAHALGKQRTLLVHNTFTTSWDVSHMQEKNIIWCFCPNANIYIENRLPDYSLFANENFCLGTDSLASNYQLDLISEANIVLKNSSFTTESVLHAMTAAPAKFIGFEKMGEIKKGNTGGLNLIQIRENKLNFISKIN